MNCIIVAGGSFDFGPDISNIIKVIKQADLIIAADRGGDHLRQMNIPPHFILGDMDSISYETLGWLRQNRIELIKYPTKKANTDTELCLIFAINQGATSITFLASTGYRLDHTLANVFLLERLSSLKIPARIIDLYNELFLISQNGIREIELEGVPGDNISIVPISGIVEGVTLNGLEYPLENAVLKRGMTLGISNCFKERICSISITDGCLLIAKSRD